MILQALEQYYQRVSSAGAGDVAPEGFQRQEIPFVIVVNRDGEFAGLQDTRTGEAKRRRARVFLVPRAVKRSSTISPNLLWDNPAYVLGKPKPDKEDKRAGEKHSSFVARIKETFPASFTDDGINAVLRFLADEAHGTLFAHPLWKEVEETGLNVSFQMEGDTGLVCQRPNVVEVIKSIAGGRTGTRQQCLVTGNLDVPVVLHAAIKGVRNAQSTGANIISFNLPAFASYGKAKGYNAPVGKNAEFAYTTALNMLLAKDSRQTMSVGDATMVFWAGKAHKMEEWFSLFFREPAKGASPQDEASVRALFAAPKTGSVPLNEDLTSFYVLGLSPNAARLSIRFWYAGTVGSVAGNIRRHFDDCAIAHGPQDPDQLSLFRLLVGTATQGKAENIRSDLGAELMKAILDGLPYPRVLLGAAVQRARAERQVGYARAALIKAVLVREARYYNKSEKEVGMSLDTGKTNAGYLLGRLFAVLERAQESANPGLDTTIRERFYGGASGTPASVFPLLLKLKNHHIAKIENKGMVVNLEKGVQEIIEKLDSFPKHLDLEGQGQFAVGYYHQRQHFFTKKTEGA